MKKYHVIFLKYLRKIITATHKVRVLNGFVNMGVIGANVNIRGCLGPCSHSSRLLHPSLDSIVRCQRNPELTVNFKPVPILCFDRVNFVCRVATTGCVAFL